jgi:F-type H+-transporting ATPase subunit g
MQTVQSYLQPLRNAISNPSSVMSRTTGAAESAAETAVNNPQTLVNRVRSMDSATLVSASVIAAETIGFFCVGEMIGRFKIVGYRGGHSHDEHH